MITLNGYEVKFGKFPNGESNMNYNNIHITDKNIKIGLKFESDQDLFNLYILKSHIDNIIPKAKIELTMYYIPYSRMDRTNMYYTFNLKYVSKFINDMKFNKVIVFDAHSDVSLGMIDRCFEKTSIPDLFDLFCEKEDICTDDMVMFYPDAGAAKRYEKTFCYPTAIGMKARNFETGNIDSFKIFSDYDLKGKDIVIIDDICSRGGTFINAAKVLKTHGVNRIYLIVAHCEDNIFTGEIFHVEDGHISSGEYIEKVYTTNSILKHNSYGTNKLVVMDIINLKSNKL